jgi:hypothetical protein
VAKLRPSVNQPTAVARWTPFGAEERAEFGDHARAGGTHSRRAKCCHHLPPALAGAVAALTV